MATSDIGSNTERLIELNRGLPIIEVITDADSADFRVISHIKTMKNSFLT